jgi:eukaryotic-like serine/threonine-protein kinase
MQSQRNNERSNRKPPTQSGPRRLAGARSAVAYQSGDVLLGKYELVSVLGEGSMGAVWLAINTALDLPVAIKLLRGNGEETQHVEALGAAFEEHLLREAQAMAKVAHPSVVRIFDFGVSDLKTPFIVMECLEGEDLREKLTRDGSMSDETTVQLLLPVMHGMQAAHVLGVVHRDLKPENIFLTRTEDGIAPKVLDFGIADLRTVKDGLGAIVCGTPDYMAPEQITRDPKPDHRVDIWSISAVLYEAITGRTPSRDNLDWSGLDSGLVTIVEKGLAHNPKDRFRSMSELGEALALWLVSRGIDHDCQGLALHSRWLYRDSGPGADTATTISPKPLFDTVISAKAGLGPTLVATRVSAGPRPINKALPTVDSDVPIIEIHEAKPLSEFPDANEQGPIVIPKNRLGAFFVVAGAIAALAGGAYLMRGALGGTHSAEAAEDATIKTAVVADTESPNTDREAPRVVHRAEPSRLAAQLAPVPTKPQPVKAVDNNRSPAKTIFVPKQKNGAGVESATLTTASPASEPAKAVQPAEPPAAAPPVAAPVAPAPVNKDYEPNVL